jgi:hypothetical protein
VTDDGTVAFVIIMVIGTVLLLIEWWDRRRGVDRW